MLQYYEQRHPDYEAIYEKPERQDGLFWLEDRLKDVVSGKRVLEIAAVQVIGHDALRK